MFNTASVRTFVAAVALTVGGSAFAGTLPISYSTTAPVTPYAAVTTGSGGITNATTPDTYVYGNSYSSLANPVFGNYEFYDDFIFTISGATANSVSTTINLGGIFALGNMEARIYDWSLNQSVPVFDQPLGTVITSTSSTFGNVTILTIDDIQLSAGTYVLEIRGNVTGTAGGAYSGVLNVAPVPVPGAFWLMSSAIAGLGMIGRKRAA